jgi:hypothetical protein
MAQRTIGTTLSDAYELNKYIFVAKNHDKAFSEGLMLLQEKGCNIGNNVKLTPMHSNTRFDTDMIAYESAIIINSNDNIQFDVFYYKNGVETEVGVRRHIYYIENCEKFKILFRHIDGTAMDYKEIHSDVKIIVYKKDVPIRYAIGNTTIEAASALINGIKMKNQIDNYIIDLKESSAKRTQVPSLTIVNDIVYSAFVTNYNSATESPADFVLKLCVFPLSDPTDITRYTVSEAGMDIAGVGTMAEQLDSFVYYDGNGNIIIVFNGKVQNGETSIFYRIFNISSSTFTESGICEFAAGTHSDTFSPSGVNNVLTLENIDHVAPTNLPGFIITQRITTRTESGETWYYSGFGEDGRFNAIVKTKNFKKWYYVATPPFTNMALYEPIVYIDYNVAYYFCRQTPQTGYSFLTRYNIVNDCWDDPVYFPDASSRSDIIGTGNYLFLINSPTTRSYIAVYMIDKNDMTKTKCLQVANFDGGAYYTANTFYNNTMYSIIPQNNLNMLFVSYGINTISSKNIINKYAELFADLIE